MNVKRYVLSRGIVSGALLAAGLLGGMAAAQEKVVEPNALKQDESMILKRRAAGFWQARIKGDFRAQYEYLEPRRQARLSPEEYREGRGVVQYLAYQVEDAVMNGNFATVQVRVLVRVNHPLLIGRRIGPQATVVSDRWIRVEGIWYRLDTPEPESQTDVESPGPGAPSPEAQ